MRGEVFISVIAADAMSGVLKAECGPWSCEREQQQGGVGGRNKDERMAFLFVFFCLA